MHKHTNRLISETSPYLLQHAHNPVNWYPWGEEALSKAKEKNKPILVSIGYAACHWCHVMERESFEDEATAQIMNEHFINIKIDREERPDIDHIYMDAVQAMTGSGGWPLNVFLTPDAKPFYGGTYFPPERAFNRAPWKEVLENVTRAFSERRHEINAQAENLTEHLVQANSFGTQKSSGNNEIFSKQKLDEAFENIMKSADKEWGGFGRAPKFPQTFTIQFLLRYHHITQNKEALQQALLSLDKMLEGGIYDHVGGGFARYSTDTEWLVPHFEKMLYDNALIISVLSEAYQLTKEKRYKDGIDETMSFIRREMLYQQSGFFSALDADSEGEEGKFYVWDITEAKEVLGENAAIFCEYYNITEKGNWEGKNILRTKTPFGQFAREKDIDPRKLEGLLKDGKEKMLRKRNKRVFPLLDDKVILSWNALMNTACSKAFMATANPEYRDLAISNMSFLLEKFSTGSPNELRHTWKSNMAKHPAFLDDYAFMIQALIHLQEITGDTGWLLKARELTEYVVENFGGLGYDFFYYTNKEQGDVLFRKKEVYDGATPSGNSIMAFNLYQLSILFDEKEWKKRSIEMVSSLGMAITRYPTSFGIWACLLQEIVSGTSEVVIMGINKEKLIADFFTLYLPHRVLMSSPIENQQFPLLIGKTITEMPLIYLCKDFVCQQPADSIDSFMSLINREKKHN